MLPLTSLGWWEPQGSILRYSILIEICCLLYSSLSAQAFVGLQLQAAALAQSVGEEITQMIAEQKKLEDRFVALVADQPQLRNLPNKNKLHENQTEVHAVAEQLRLGTQALVRNLKVGCLHRQPVSQPMQFVEAFSHSSHFI